MLSFSPVKLLIVLVVAAILVGPDKLPQVGRQLGAAWRTFRSFHERVEQEVRQTLPDLPSTGEIARLARSPVAFLNQLADLPGPEPAVPDPAAAAPNGASGAAANGAAANGAADGTHWPADGAASAPSPSPSRPHANGSGGDRGETGGVSAAPASPFPSADPSMN